MKDGIIELDSEFGRKIGFTSDKFFVSSYLWKKEGYIYISAIESREKGKGHQSSLFNAILSKGYGIKVPNPFPLMEVIIGIRGFARTEETSERYPEPVEVWVKEKNK